MTAARPLSVLICALGGQGGGLLAEWLGEAAHSAGYPAQATSIPGVAQRTGATTYYFELYPERAAEGEPIFCLFPSAGDVDLVAALEPMEAARALRNGYVSPNTTVITTRARVYGIGEKIVPGDGTVPAETALEALADSANRLVVLDTALAADGAANALLLGVIAAAGVLPLSIAEYRRGIEAAGVAAAANLAAFERGLTLESSSTWRNGEESALLEPCPAAFEAGLLSFPAALRPLIGHALARLTDYQDAAYAARYLARLRAVAALDKVPDAAADKSGLTAIVARRLAAWMSFEDVIRVAQLKTRQGRLARIRAELGAGAGDPLDVVDYMKPGWDELRGLLPRRLGPWIPASKPGERRRGLALTLATGRPWGYAALRLAARLKPWRPHTIRFAEEERAIEAWLDAITATAASDKALACQLAELAALARGYGDVRSRGLAHLERLLAGWRGRLATDAAALAGEVAAVLDAARSDPDAGCAPV